MISLAHMLLGAVIGSKINNTPLAIILAVLGHYFLDLFPHIEYSIDNISEKKWGKALPDILKVFIDFCSAILIILIFSKNQPIIYVCALAAMIPDGLTVLNSIFPNKILTEHDKIHHEKIHYLTKQKKFPIFWRISTQVITVIICIILLKY